MFRGPRRQQVGEQERLTGTVVDQKIAAACDSAVGQGSRGVAIQSDSAIDESRTVNGVDFAGKSQRRIAQDSGPHGANEKIVDTIAIQVDVWTQGQRSEQIGRL